MLSTSLWIILYFTLIIGLIFGVRILRDRRIKWRFIEPDTVTILVPFRNEKEHLKQFLEQCVNQTEQVSKWIFINDHSTDGGKEIVAQYCNDFSFIDLLYLPEGDEGKKMAIRFGLIEVETDFFITMDADVRFGKKYVESLKKMPDADLLILPVEMTAQSWWQIPFQFEYSITHLLNKGITGWKRPINASGANLFFDRKVFEEIDDIDAHAHIASGDDIYALRAFRSNNKEIAIVEKDDLKVFTDTPKRMSLVLEQRLRWLTKSSDVGDKLSNGLGIVAVLMHLWYFMLLIATYFGNAALLTLILITIKGIIDYALLSLDIKKWDLRLFFGLILFEVIYPVYLMLLLVSTVFTQSEWKGRVEQK